ncbi:energy transducer TonB [Microvirga pudoricolor]|uniref:energy transducer TonB n=1 Tax=Microvirga pudoricolor TaxID=2778729 RepID=UPI001950836E|nr:energy transducer TonB [Microvirga pudoricolor]MBM6596254.1 TonB C-terminal domain-containing protein [Microvirga pudoricolor]
MVRWTLAAVMVVGAHAGVVWAAMNWPSAQASAGSAPPAVMIDLEPIAANPEPPPADAAPEPEVVEAPPPLPEPEPDLPELPPVAEPVFDPPEPDPLPEPPPPLDLKLPELPAVPNAAAVLAPPPPPPKREEPKKVEPKKPEPKKEVERRKPEPPRRRAERPTAPPAAEAPPASRPAESAPGVTATPSAAAARWRSAASSRIKPFITRTPPNLRPGSVSVSITIDRTGRIVAVRIARSSGQEALDQLALRDVQRASPLPAPPPEQVNLTLTMGINFTR